MPGYPVGHPPPGWPPYGHPHVLGYGQLDPRLDRRSRSRRRRKPSRSRSRRPRKGAARARKQKPRPPPSPPEKAGVDGAWEVSKEEKGLQLTSELAPPGVQWDVKLRDVSRRCFAAFLPSPISDARCREFFQKIRDGTEWLQPDGALGPIPRKTSWMVCQGCTCRYRYGGVEVEPVTYPPWMIELLGVYMPYCGINNPSDWPNGCNVNLYENGSHQVGWHSDDEPLFQGKFRDIRIISLSLGQPRRFDLKLNWPEEGEQPETHMSLGCGSLCTMEGMTQKHYMHRVPRESENLGPRINLTWRWVVQHAGSCAHGRR
ncbi:unnamed protein product [Prorocentrum cordatum]|uniref:Fe2OG dioxygenase domain-containing protein n=2 Tax=Prorocentrum cordatum TaxID=2364126 RepID=A0ABN9VA29_9DINO|nr:unnamed protein product [Polarella glacialis]